MGVDELARPQCGVLIGEFYLSPLAISPLSVSTTPQKLGCVDGKKAAETNAIQPVVLPHLARRLANSSTDN
jgi:hypothetical protein